MLWLELNGLALRIADNQFLHLEISESSAHAELPIDSVLNDEAIGSFDAAFFVGAGRLVNRVHLRQITILVDKRGDGVTEVGNCKSTVKDKSHQTGGSIGAAILAGI